MSAGPYYFKSGEGCGCGCCKVWRVRLARPRPSFGVPGATIGEGLPVPFLLHYAAAGDDGGFIDRYFSMERSNYSSLVISEEDSGGAIQFVGSDLHQLSAIQITDKGHYDWQWTGPRQGPATLNFFESGEWAFTAHLTVTSIPASSTHRFFDDLTFSRFQTFLFGDMQIDRADLSSYFDPLPAPGAGGFWEAVPVGVRGYWKDECVSQIASDAFSGHYAPGNAKIAVNNLNGVAREVSKLVVQEAGNHRVKHYRGTIGFPYSQWPAELVSCENITVAEGEEVEILPPELSGDASHAEWKVLETHVSCPP